MDRYRPIYHFTAPSNWMNDPNGPFQWKGEYHLFYQHNPAAPEWGDIHWGHAKSADLVNWTHLPAALSPSRELGEHHCFSGCSVVSGGEVTLFYTSIGEGDRNPVAGAQQWMARGKDLRNWRKAEHNPVLTSDLHGDMNVTEWRDPYVWKEQDGWRMLLGGTEGGSGCGMIYQSDDLEHWTFRGILYRGEESIWECPHLFRFGDQAVLFYSPSGPVRYISGTIRNDRLTDIVHRGTADYGGWEGYYASTGFVDEADRRILLGWVPEGSRGSRFPEAMDWAGALALPRIVDLKPSGVLSMAPIPEIEALRGECCRFTDLAIGQAPVHTGVRLTAFECVAEAGRRAGGEWIISLFVSECGRESTDVRLCPADNTITIDRSRSSLFPGVHISPVQGKLPAGANDDPIKVRIFADQSIIEVFVDDETCLTARVYPSLPDSSGIALHADSEMTIAKLEIWEMKAAAFAAESN
ncbi:glycoside hydrolase family 32 protein [Paenibacillus protaetiae]|uniref:beta-fructofuranosidase n=1 Tax=Paenibacillus protaetiae TaxID=2509456 RepID=A0A4P6EQL1_9BACL|nr:glycoside hydrolase family 32 protein [Paenibacillus protaetiae]QAY65260.1 glycoside hydrolase family 32 protein [Paenibacillus protaetiae]